MRALQLGLTGQQAAGRELAFLGAALGLALAVAGLCEHAFGGDHRLVEVGVALLGVGQLQVEFLEAGLAGGAAFLDALVLFVERGQVLAQARRGGVGGVEQLGGARQLDLQAMGTGAQALGAATGLGQLRRHLGVLLVGAAAGGACLVAEQLLRAALAFEVFDLLRACQQAGLLAVGGVEAHRVPAHGVAGLGDDELAMLELVALRQRALQIGGGVDTIEPVGQQGPETARFEAQQRGEFGQVVVRGLGWLAVGQGVEGHARGRRVALEGAHQVEARHLDGAHALAQGGLQRGLPAGFDMQALPKSLQMLKTLLRQPGAELALGLHLLLQRAQRVEACAQACQLRLLLLGVLAGPAAIGIQLGLALAQVDQPPLRVFEQRIGLLAALAQALQLAGVGQVELDALLLQALAALARGARLFVQRTAFGGQHLDLLLHLGHAGTLRVGVGLGLAQPLLQLRQARRLLFGAGGEQLALLLSAGELGLQLLALVQRLLSARLPGGALRQHLVATLGGAVAAVHHVADALLEPADGQLRLGVATLLGVQGVAGLVMLDAHGLQIGLGGAQLRELGLELVERLAAGGLHALGVLGGVAALQEPELMQAALAQMLQLAVARRHFGLAFELLQIAAELAQDVVDARQVLAGVLQPVLGLAAPFLVLGDTGGLLEKEAQLLGPAFDDAADGALADDGVGAWAQPGAEKDVVHVLAAHRLVVDEVARSALARQHALDGDLGVLVPGPAGARQLVVEHQLDAGSAGRLARVAAVEDDVEHRLAAQLAGLALAQHPAHGVHDVGLAATVGAHHTDALTRKLEGGGVGEGLEARELDRIQAHAGPALTTAVTAVFIEKTGSKKGRG